MKRTFNSENKKELRKKNNKGFSLVELIVVIAIMAILVGIVGTQVLPYMEKSRQAKDMQVVSAICTAAVTTFAEHAGELGTNDLYSYVYTDTANQAADNADASKNAAANVNKEIRELLGVNTGDTDYLFKNYITGKLESKVGKTAKSLRIKYDKSTGQVTVQLFSGETPTDAAAKTPTADAVAGNAILEAVTSK